MYSDESLINSYLCQGFQGNWLQRVRREYLVGVEICIIRSEAMTTWMYIFAIFIKLYPKNSWILLCINYRSIKQILK